ncbi:MAG: sigma 54-interacting transcriptional regulator [Deltaproteobacteria bacterium]|nr:sigma 54-interacting transcriptional regulator [Deltaproteobacteria bacterium]
MTSRKGTRPTATFTRDDQGSSRRYLLIFEGGAARAIDLPVKGRVVLGRSPDVDVVLSHESVSRRHAELLVHGPSVIAKDLGSRNGTRIGGKPIVASTPMQPGEVAQLGTVAIMLGDATEAKRQAGLLTHAEFEARSASRLGEARTRGEPLILFLVEATAQAESLVPSLRELLGEDTLFGAHATSHLEALTQAQLGCDPVSRALSVKEALAREGVVASVGAALFPEGGSSVDELTLAARRALRPSTTDAEPTLVAGSPRMRRVVDLSRRVAAGRIPVLILGETGTGKEVIAEAIHRWSPRAHKPLVRINCAALPEALLEAELFGYERGAFTGAIQPKQGLFEMADGGTLLLDEVGELPAGQQAKLLRVLEDGTIRRVGGLKDRRVDVRLVAATNRDIELSSSSGQFRADLYFRLSGTTIPLPPLRERAEDLLALARHFAHVHGQEGPACRPIAMAPETEEILLRYSWPGNVRELRNAIERAVLLCHGEVLLPEHLPDRVRLSPSLGSSQGRNREHPIGTDPRPVLPIAEGGTSPVRRFEDVRGEMKDLERARIVEALEACAWNQTRAASQLGISRRTLVSKIAIYGLNALRPPRER